MTPTAVRGGVFLCLEQASVHSRNDDICCALINYMLHIIYKYYDIYNSFRSLRWVKRGECVWRGN